MKKLRTLTPLRKLGEDKPENTVIKNSMVTREQYDHDVTTATDRFYAEIRTLQERQEAQETHTRTLAALWALTTLFGIVAVLILAING